MSSEVKFENHAKSAKEDTIDSQKVKLTDLLARLNSEKKREKATPKDKIVKAAT